MKRIREHFVTCGQMKILEQRADKDGLSYYRMMENAGTQAARIIVDKLGTGKNSAAKKEKTAADAAYNFTLDDQLKVAESGIADTRFAKGSGESRNLSRNSDEINRNNSDEINGTNGISGINEKIQVFCGKGNNGGDGFVVARKLLEAGYDVTVILVDGEPVTEDGKTNFELIRKENIKIFDMSADGRVLMELRETPAAIVDAIYGTGFHGKLAGEALKAAFYINKFYEKACGGKDDVRTKIFSLDIPSGMGGDLTNEKELDVNSITAHCTITFHARKPVHLQKFAAGYCGEVIVADIGIDEDRLWNIDY